MHGLKMLLPPPPPPPRRAQRPVCSEKNTQQTKQLLRDTFITSIRGEMLEENKRPGLPVLVLFAVHPSALEAAHDGSAAGAD